MEPQTERRIVLTDAKEKRAVPCCGKPKVQPAGAFGDEYEVCLNCGREFRGGER